MTGLTTYSLFLVLAIAGALIKALLPRQLLLIAASYVAYSTWGTTFLIILIASSLFNYGCGEFIRRNPTVARLGIGIGANVLLLGFFKTTQLWGADNIAMPVGISFWTFQALSYLLDVYRQEDVDPTVLEFCLYMALWPTVIMGPICRLTNMLPQFRERNPVSSPDLLWGVRRVVIGLFMKLAISQTLVSGLTAGTGVAAGFDRRMDSYGGLDVWFLAIGFGFQLFFDFAGYSHIVIGLASIFGLRLEENFDAPFLALTPSEFWTRWHMSLSSWIRDYVFMPLAAIKRDVWWRYCALLLAMTLFGLWHGAKGSFVLWGMYQGLLLVSHRVIQQYTRNFNSRTVDTFGKVFSWPVSFLAVSLGWVAFRADTLTQALSMYRGVFSPWTYGRLALSPEYYRFILVVIVGYFGYHTVGVALIQRLQTALTPARTDFLAEFGITKNFVTLVSLIPVVFMLFFVLLIVRGGSEGVSPFVYAVF